MPTCRAQISSDGTKLAANKYQCTFTYKTAFGILIKQNHKMTVRPPLHIANYM